MSIELTLPTDAITAGNEVTFTLSSAFFAGNSLPVISVEGLDGAETASLFFKLGDEFDAVRNGGDAVVFSTDLKSVALTSTGTYGLIKDATTSELTVRVTSRR